MKRDLGKHFKIVAVSFLAAISVAVGQDGNHHRIYPFDVTIAGEVAVLQGSGDATIFARTRKVVKNDVEEKLDIEPTMIIVNVDEYCGRVENRARCFRNRRWQS